MTMTAAFSVAQAALCFNGKTGQALGVNWANEVVAKVARNPARAKLLLVGEVHDDPVAHKCEVELFNALAEVTPDESLTLSMEFFNTDEQLVADEFFTHNTITEKEFTSGAGAPGNYETDYKPLVDAAKTSSACGRFLCSNAPKRYVSLARRMSSQEMASTLTKEALALLPPLPIPEPSEAYKEKFSETVSVMMGGKPVPPSMICAQSMWDACMSWTVANVLRSTNPKAAGVPSTVMHVGGAFHIEQGLGLAERLEAQSNGEWDTVSVTFCPAELSEGFVEEKHKGLADFVVLTDKSEPRSF